MNDQNKAEIVDSLNARILVEQERGLQLQQACNESAGALQLARKQNEIISKKIAEKEKENERLSKQFQLISKQNSGISLVECNKEYVDSIETALTDIQYGDMSMGDLNRLYTIFLKEMNRVNGLIERKIRSSQ